MADQYVKALFNALRGAGQKRYTYYPIVALSMPAGVALPHDNNLAAGAWGAWTQITLAVASPAVEFWLCACTLVVDAAAVERHAINIGSGLVATPPTGIAQFFFAANTIPEVDMSQKYVPYPVYMPAATPTSGQSATLVKVAAANITVALLLATGL